MSDTRWYREDVAEWFAQGDAFAALAQTRGEVLREMPVRRTRRIRLGERSYVLKEHFGVGWREIAKNLASLRWPVLGAGNEVWAAARLAAAKIPGPTVAAWAVSGGNPARRRSFVLLDDIAHIETMEDVVARWHRTPPAANERRRRIEQVARIARGMHAAGVAHSDFYLCHFLCEPSGALRLIDLHRARPLSGGAERIRRKDLAALYFSALDAKLSTRDLLRFLRIYGGGRLPRGKAWRFWQAVEVRARQLYTKGTRLGITAAASDALS